MKKYTFEELSTPGTKIVINKELQYRCQQWKDTEPNYIFIFDKSNYEIKSTPVSYRGIIYIIFDNIDSQLNHYMVSISEFERVGLLKETFPEKWQLNVKQLSNEQLVVVKKWINKNSQSGCYSYNLDAFEYLIFPLWNNNTHICDSIKLDYTEITFEQFQKHILKEIPMNKRTITKEQAQSIVDSACSTWKEKLCAKWATSIVLGLSIDIDEAFYKEMRGACTKDQHELFDKIFGSDKKEIEWDKLKTGSVVMIKYTSQHCNGFYEIDKNKPVNIIFYETKHFINSDKEFKKQGNNSSYYITFHQDGRYVLFTSDKNNDCIIDVIEY